jgi:PLP dependent protein
MSLERLEHNLKIIQERIKIAAKNSKQDSNNIKILPITKGRKIELINLLPNLGYFEIGENRVEEIEEKYPYLKGRFKIHLVGKLQKRKVKIATALIDVIHSLDNLEIAKLINESAKQLNKVIHGFIEVNLAGEENKSGIKENQIEDFLSHSRNFTNLKIIGLMTMPPQTSNPENSRIYFRKLKKLAQQYNLAQLSMGTTQDYEIAVQEGATILRIGQALFEGIS